MYLSRVRLDTAKRRTLLALAAPQQLHGAVENCFDVTGPRKRNLWRVDALHGGRYLMILSEDRPRLEQLRLQFGFPGEADEIREYEALLARIKAGSQWQFRLTANPTRSVISDGMARGKAVAHVSVHHAMEWLQRKAALHGFAIMGEGSCVTASGWKIFSRGGNRASRVRLKEVTYEGRLRVEAAERFCEALCRGIGRGKAYGMGLITVMRA